MNIQDLCCLINTKLKLKAIKLINAFVMQSQIQSPSLIQQRNYAGMTNIITSGMNYSGYDYGQEGNSIN